MSDCAAEWQLNCWHAWLQFEAMRESVCKNGQTVCKLRQEIVAYFPSTCMDLLLNFFVVVEFII